MNLTFEVDPEMGPAVAQGYMIAAAALLQELAESRGDGPWFDVLREAIKWRAFDLQAPVGAHPEVAEKWADAAMMAIDHVFDHVTFEDKPPRG